MRTYSLRVTVPLLALHLLLLPGITNAADTASATIDIRDAKATSEGIQATVILSHADVYYAEVQLLDNDTGEWGPYVTTLAQPVPGPLANTNTNKSGTLTIPILTPGGSTEKYRLTLYVSTRTEAGPNTHRGFFTNTQTAFTSSTPLRFDGLSLTQPPVSQLTPISLKFNSDKLTVAAKTGEVASLSAAWQVPGNSNPVGMQAMQNHQDPTVDLMYADLGVPAANAQDPSLPEIKITLQDKGNTQETIVSIAVNVTQQVKAAKKSAQAQPGKAKFSWSDLAKTGVAGLLTYFTTVL
jgi:hypothetical protein